MASKWRPGAEGTGGEDMEGRYRQKGQDKQRPGGASVWGTPEAQAWGQGRGAPSQGTGPDGVRRLTRSPVWCMCDLGGRRNDLAYAQWDNPPEGLQGGTETTQLTFEIFPPATGLSAECGMEGGGRESGEEALGCPPGERCWRLRPGGAVGQGDAVRLWRQNQQVFLMGSPRSVRVREEVRTRPRTNGTAGNRKEES